MRITKVLNGPPVFRFWKEFGEGKTLKKRQGYLPQWNYKWNFFVRRMEIADKTIPQEKLPPSSIVMDASDFMVGHIDALPEKLMKIKSGEKVVYDHPWPYNFVEDPMKNQEPIYHYTIDTRLFSPSEDVQHFTNTLIETDRMKAYPPLAPTDKDFDQLQRKIDWALHKDSVLVRLPGRREFPKINMRPNARYGITDERAESNLLKSVAHYSQTVLANHSFHDKEKFNQYLKLLVLSYPHCKVLFERDSHKIGLDLFIDHMTVANDPIPPINPSPDSTISKELSDIRPRSWRSVIEKRRFYENEWSFKFPHGSFPRTIYLASRIKRDLPNEEMMSRNIIHAYGLTRQLATLKEYKLPISLQVISYKLLPVKTFFFTRFQLNTLDFSGVKNQAWHSGPIEDVEEAFLYFLDFENVDSKVDDKMLTAIPLDDQELEKSNECA